MSHHSMKRSKEFWKSKSHSCLEPVGQLPAITGHGQSLCYRLSLQVTLGSWTWNQKAQLPCQGAPSSSSVKSFLTPSWGFVLGQHPSGIICVFCETGDSVGYQADPVSWSQVSLNRNAELHSAIWRKPFGNLKQANSYKQRVGWWFPGAKGGMNKKVQSLR